MMKPKKISRKELLEMIAAQSRKLEQDLRQTEGFMNLSLQNKRETPSRPKSSVSSSQKEGNFFFKA